MGVINYPNPNICETLHQYTHAIISIPQYSSVYNCVHSFICCSQSIYTCIPVVPEGSVKHSIQKTAIFTYLKVWGSVQNDLGIRLLPLERPHWKLVILLCDWIDRSNNWLINWSSEWVSRWMGGWVSKSVRVSRRVSKRVRERASWQLIKRLI